MDKANEIQKILNNLWANPNLTDLRALENLLNDKNLLTPEVAETLDLLWNEQIRSTYSNQSLRKIEEMILGKL